MESHHRPPNYQLGALLLSYGRKESGRRESNPQKPSFSNWCVCLFHHDRIGREGGIRTLNALRHLCLRQARLPVPPLPHESTGWDSNPRFHGFAGRAIRPLWHRYESA